MADLLSAGDLTQIFGALKDVTDTFYKDPVTYHGHVNVVDDETELDRFDETAEVSAEDVELMCRATVLDDADTEAKPTPEGTKVNVDIELRFNAQDLRDANLMTLNAPVFDPEKDFFTYDGKRYKLEMVEFDDTDFAGVIVIVVCKCNEVNKAA